MRFVPPKLTTGDFTEQFPCLQNRQEIHYFESLRAFLTEVFMDSAVWVGENVTICLRSDLIIVFFLGE
ncbi:MAG: hypothetical protein ACI97A_003270 [Planctomycetota bacterium]|jgi:hypothetical protein